MRLNFGGFGAKGEKGEKSELAKAEPMFVPKHNPKDEEFYDSSAEILSPTNSMIDVEKKEFNYSSFSESPTTSPIKSVYSYRQMDDTTASSEDT